MALPDPERRVSGWKCSKTALPEEDVISLLNDFAELKRKERKNDPEVKRVKNKYKLKASAYPSPGNILHTGRQLPRSPGPGVLPLLPSQQFEPQELGDECFEQLRSFSLTDLDNIVPSGKQLQRTPLFTKPEHCHVLREIHPNTKSVSSTQKLSRTANNSVICNTTPILIHVEPVKISDTLEDIENESPVAEISAHKGMALPDTERGTSGWKCSKTAVYEEDATNLLKEFAELKRKERENNPNVKRVKSKYKLKASSYPSPGNILHTGHQLPRSPGPGVLPLLPSQKFEAQEPGDESFEQLRSFPVKELDNIVPSGKQLPHTPPVTEPAHCHVMGEIQPNTRNVNSTQKLSRTVKNSVICNTTQSHVEPERISDTLKDIENESPVAEISAHKETTEEGNVSRHQACNKRRISELPVQGLNRMRISGVLKKMPGYECRSEDLEFLTCIKMQEKAKVLKAELLCLRKDLAAGNQDKELLIARRDKIEEDTHRMKSAYTRTLQLGRAFLSRTQDFASVQGLSSQDVLKQLNHLTVQSVHQQKRAQLLAAQKEVTRRREEAASVTRPLEDPKSSLMSKIESYEKCVNTAKERIQQLNDEVITLKTQIEKTYAKKSELEESVEKKREHINQCLEQQAAPPPQTDISEEECERMNRRMQRILHRKNLYLERERILQKLKRDLK